LILGILKITRQYFVRYAVHNNAQSSSKLCFKKIEGRGDKEKTRVNLKRKKLMCIISDKYFSNLKARSTRTREEKKGS
jgi:hypothetical protein